MNYPVISIAIATFNSERTLEATLDSIKKQTYPKNRIEILIADGRSNDETIKIAKSFGSRMLSNPKIPRLEMVYAKHIAFYKATGKYLMYLDSDEILENPNSLMIKYLTFTKNKRVRAVLPSGYKAPASNSSINSYIGEFGDPFSFFIYHESKGDQFLIKEFREKFHKNYEDKDCIIFDLSKTSSLPLIELWAGGSILDLKYTKFTFPQIKKDPGIVAHLFYLLNLKKNLIGVTKNDSTIHNSVESLNGYLKKINIRIRNNIFRSEMGTSGFLDRQNFSSTWLNIKKYLFIPYSFSIIFPLIDATEIALSRKKSGYLIHLPLCIFTSIMILYYYFLRILNIKPKFIKLKSKNYGI